MKELGLAEVLNPSEIFLEERPVGLRDQQWLLQWKEQDQF